MSDFEFAWETPMPDDFESWEAEMRRCAKVLRDAGQHEVAEGNENLANALKAAQLLKEREASHWGKYRKKLSQWAEEKGLRIQAEEERDKLKAENERLTVRLDEALGLLLNWKGAHQHKPKSSLVIRTTKLLTQSPDTKDQWPSQRRMFAEDEA